jgi:DNA-binding beta-propeller fold protein YncE
MPVSTGHHGIDVSPVGKMVYVSKIGSDKVNVIDLIKLEFVK